MFSPISFRTVPQSAPAGSVAPTSVRRSVMAFSFSSIIGTTGPEVMKATSESRKGLPSWTA